MQTWGLAKKPLTGWLITYLKPSQRNHKAIAGVEPLLKAFQGDVDKVRTEKSELQKQYDELKAKQEKGGEPGKKNAIN